MARRDFDRSVLSDPATRTAFPIPLEMEPTRDPAGLHAEDDLDELLDRERRSDDDATAHTHGRRESSRPADPYAPEEWAEDVIALGTQGGGSFAEDDDEGGLEEHVDREALAAGIVPQLVGQATLESASITDAQVLDEEADPDEDAPTLPRPHAAPGRTGVHRVARRDAR